MQNFMNFIFGESENKAIPVRVIQNDSNEPWFVAKDVAEALEYSDASLGQPNNLMQNVPDQWKGHKQIMTLGGNQDMLCLSEQGLYFFLGRSDKPKALPFQIWLAGEVLPSIRKTGGYALNLDAETMKEVMRLPEAYKKETFKRLLALAEKGKHNAETMQLIIDISRIFAAAETGAALEQGTLTF